MNKTTFLIIAVLILVTVGVFGIRLITGEDNWICINGEWVKHGMPITEKPNEACTWIDKIIGSKGEEPVVGGDEDEYGCKPSAGYQWCPSKEKCMRMWEEYCEEFKEQFKIENFNDCVLAGNPILESHPRQCQTKDGQSFIEMIENNKNKSDLIRLTTPEPEQEISSPLIIEGEARGTWYFEATFPVILTDWDGVIIAQGYAQALGEWMTEKFVPFKAELEFTKPDTGVSNRGALILKKDNPSGLPEYDDALEITIYYK